jgi:WS/DGAT/MGAT family acyltransferase
MELDDLKRIKNTVGNCTLNDVLLSVVAGSMRHYLNEKNQLPDKTLVVGVPISTRAADANNAEGGNEVAGMRLNLRTDIEDPVERLRAINHDAVSSKAYANAIGAERMTTVLNSIPSGIASLGMRVMATTGLSARTPVAHTIVTNVPGPQFPLYFCGAKASLWIGLGCLMDGLGLFHTVNSYNGYVFLSFVCCREMMPDPDFYHQCINRSLEEHLSAVREMPNPHAKQVKQLKAKSKAVPTLR